MAAIPIAANDPFGQISMKEGALQQNQFSEVKTFKAILYYCVLILGGPVVTFFLVKNIVLPVITQWDVDEVKTNVTSAIAAVVVLHIALGLFIFKAYFSEEDEKRKIGKSD